MNVSVKTALGVFVGGALGSAARIGVGLILARFDGTWWPYSVLVVNLVGSFALGFLVGNGMHRLPVWARMGATTGFLGAFTTLSAISLDVAVPIVRHGAVEALVMAPYAIGTMIVGVICAIVGLRLGARSAGDS
ncbi:MAG: fluoride efflux transporter CrcB [Actinomycetota bacterium]|jgi:CrcB protein